MNTKKVIFGLLAIVLLVATSVSTATIDTQEYGVDRTKMPKNPK